jgi:hypothetical protein
MKKLSLLLLFSILSSCIYAQLAIAKMVGKNADKAKLGFGAFSYIDIPTNEEGTQSFRIELLDFAYFPRKIDEDPSRAYLSIKLGYKYIFSETKTGFYVEPQAGYCRVVVVEQDAPEAAHGDGIAAALEAGYSLEVGERGNTFNFGLKYETDRAGSEYTINSIGFRVSYSFNLLRRRE